MTGPAFNASGRTEFGRWPTSYVVVFAAAALAMGGFYFASVRALQGPFQWRGEQSGYYNWLGRAFAEGHLRLSVEPRPELLALPNPWDPARNGPYMVRDLALYRGHYYMYHGPTPACLLFTPYRFLTHYDLPESFAAYLFCLLGDLACCGTLMRLWSSNGTRPALFWFAVLLLAMGICNSAPYLLERVMVYEVALAGGFFCVSGGFYFLARALTGPRLSLASLALSGLMLGLAIGCRPPLALAGMAACGAIWWCLRGKLGAGASLLAFTLPLGVCALMLAGYNYARFHDPFEFGLRYIMASSDYFGFSPSFRNLVPGLYYLLASLPDFDPVFPFVRLMERTHFNPDAPFLPTRYFLEPIAGAFAIWPLGVVALGAPAIALRGRNRAVGALVGALFLFAAGSVGFVATLGLATQRFHADWQPPLVLLTCFVLGMASGLSRWRIAALGFAICTAAILYSVVTNVAIAFQGPYDQLVQIHPEKYVRLARWFSPVERFRPLFDPPVTVEAAYEFPGRVESGRLPLVTAGRFGSRYVLSVEMLSTTRLRLTSATAPIFGSVRSAEIDVIPGAPNHLRLDYRPAGGAVTVQWNGATVLRHEIPFLVTAPFEVTAGEDRAEIDSAPSHFPGRVSVVNISINEIRRP